LIKYFNIILVNYLITASLSLFWNIHVDVIITGMCCLNIHPLVDTIQ
jgi:hypothetical protein